MMTVKEKFEKIFKENITREGADKLLDWLEKTDFFVAPASTMYHSCHEGGLCEHSLNVYSNLQAEVNLYKTTNPVEGAKISEETMAICGLLHDLRKTNFYKKSLRNVKNEETGEWEKVPFYKVEDQFPYSHGEGAVFLIERFMRLSVTEAMAISCHMGGFDDAARGGSHHVSNAFSKYPLAVLMHTADLKATYIDEKDE